ncbi:uncharacterized RNA pseudouridine synthase Caur_0901-like [Ylistrum balloti]|uniref:uncharacterized RNA pseudouridine synthase Caur_0901-like n=1 Tax=Ylistrum balloti TaxID=509963 RepID=UPI0029058A17|nr:uncharacterized RNA pseudouridine synthase Caur_0901-like [Ylistrum balloti]
MALLPPPVPRNLVAQPVPFTCLYADEAIIVVDKPAGVIVHPGALNEQGTLVHGLLQDFPDLLQMGVQADGKRPGIVHRLDKGTSGVMVVARTEAARLQLIEQFQCRAVKKIYIAWVWGETPCEGRWDGAIARHPKQRKKFTVIPHGKPSLTLFRTIARHPTSSKIELDLCTGRTHQIRVHASQAGYPLLGDPLYKSRGRIVQHKLQDWGPERERPALHALQLAFVHPTHGENMVFTAPIPKDLQQLDCLYESL